MGSLQVDKGIFNYWVHFKILISRAICLILIKGDSTYIYYVHLKT
jgi:hypothetical protein